MERRFDKHVIKNKTRSQCKNHEELSLQQLCNLEEITNSLMINLNKDRSAIHITWISPNKLALFDKDLYLKTKGENLDDDDPKYIDDLHLDKCIMRDNTACKLHNFDEVTEGQKTCILYTPIDSSQISFSVMFFANLLTW